MSFTPGPVIQPSCGTENWISYFDTCQLNIMQCVFPNFKFNPLSSNIHVQILQTYPYTFPKECVERI